MWRIWFDNTTGWIYTTVALYAEASREMGLVVEFIPDGF